MAEGKRFNEGKLRYDLIHAKAQEGLVQVLTAGSKKYAERNWELGMKWTTVLASLKRHLAAIERGEDYDSETGLLHIDHVQCNAHFLSAYYRTKPEHDDRPQKYLIKKKVGLDIDGLLADFIGHLMNVSGHIGYIPTHWNDPIVITEFEKVKGDPKFWTDIPALIKKEEIPFEPHCYITARSIDSSVTQEWLNKNGFPIAKLHCVGTGESKVEVAKNAGIDIFVDDSFENFRELNSAGILTILYTAPYNTNYEVGFKRVASLKEFSERFL